MKADASTLQYEKRLHRLFETLDADVVALVPGANMVYFTGLHFHLSERPVIALLSRDGIHIIVPELEAIKLQERPELEARAYLWRDETGYDAAFTEAVSALNLGERTLALDGQTMRVFEWLAFQRAGVAIQQGRDVGQALLDVRAQKDAAEIDAIRRAIAISERALAETLAWVRPGTTERAIAAHLSQRMRELGGQGDAFGPLVLTGDKSASPHGNTGDRPLGDDEVLLIDFGAQVDGYPADITRTFCLGTPSEELSAIHDAVLRANQAARKVAGPGVPCGEVDRAARDVIEAAGYGPYFIHRTGHGLGLEVHEQPQIVAGNAQTLQAGMVFTIEPGIYVPGVGGVRIEDNVVVTAEGVEVLTRYPRALK